MPSAAAMQLTADRTHPPRVWREQCRAVCYRWRPERWRRHRFGADPGAWRKRCVPPAPLCPHIHTQTHTLIRTHTYCTHTYIHTHACQPGAFADVCAWATQRRTRPVRLPRRLRARSAQRRRERPRLLWLLLQPPPPPRRPLARPHCRCSTRYAALFPVVLAHSWCVCECVYSHASACMLEYLCVGVCVCVCSGLVRTAAGTCQRRWWRHWTNWSVYVEAAQLGALVEGACC
jgi:hypothetical protein